jgi:L-fuculose-phosphate aldolase
MTSREEIVFFSKLAYDRHYSVGGEGNISVREGDDLFEITPSGILKPLLSPEDIVVIDGEGHTVSGRRKPSSEFLAHLEVYRQNPAVNAVIHAHPMFTVLSTVTGEYPFEHPFLAEAVLFLDRVKTVPYAQPAGPDTARTVSEACGQSDAIIVERHGTFTYGKNLQEAFTLLEIMEKCAEMHFRAKESGNRIKNLSEEEIRELRKDLNS